ncbi:MAG: haloacid dehalogenase, partial [Gammaproteobacteria bacterium]
MRFLPWLPSAPDDFSAQCSQLEPGDKAVATIIELASVELTMNQCHRLYRKASGSAEISTALQKELPQFKLGLISNGTFDLIVPVLVATALRYGICLEVILADFDQVAQEAFNPDSAINQAKPDAVLIALDYRGYPFAANTWAKSEHQSVAGENLEYLQQLREGFRVNCGGTCIVQTLATPPNFLMGSLDSQVDGTLRKEISDFNRALATDVYSCADLLLDVAELANMIGTAQWFDERQWYMGRMPVANEYVPIYCEHVLRL